MLEKHNDTEEDDLKIKKQMAQFMANAVTQVTMCCQPITDKKLLTNFGFKFYNKTSNILLHCIVKLCMSSWTS